MNCSCTYSAHIAPLPLKLGVVLPKKRVRQSSVFVGGGGGGLPWLGGKWQCNLV